MSREHFEYMVMLLENRVWSLDSRIEYNWNTDRTTDPELKNELEFARKALAGAKSYLGNVPRK